MQVAHLGVDRRQRVLTWALFMTPCAALEEGHVGSLSILTGQQVRPPLRGTGGEAGGNGRYSRLHADPGWCLISRYDGGEDQEEDKN